MRRLAVAAVATAIALGGCGGTQELVSAPARHGSAAASPAARSPSAQSPSVHSPSADSPSADSPSAQSVYLAQLGTEQTNLATAEQTIPTNPRTPAALAHSVDLLRAAVTRLADGLAAIKPPANVAAAHARLVTIMRAYAGQLDRAAQVAVGAGGEPRAGALLISATDQASRAFTTTINTIDATLGSTR